MDKRISRNATGVWIRGVLLVPPPRAPTSPKRFALFSPMRSKVNEFRENLEIPKGVHLMDECGMIMSDIPRFMIFAKWWIKGEMTDEIIDLFMFHYCEINEVDFYWVLMDEPGNYYGLGIEGDRSQCGYEILESEFKRIGTRSKKKARINFKMEIGHD